MTLQDGNENGRRRELVVIEVYYEGDALIAGFSKEDQKHLGLPAEAPLNVDTSAYQRSLSQKHVETIREDWDAVAADAPVLSFRPDGSLWIVNGQHVIAAAVLEGERELLAWVHVGWTVPGEADLRLKKNAGRADTALEKFHARLTKEREEPGNATAVVRLLEQFNTYVNRAPNKHVGINCVGTVLKLYERDGGAQLRRTLKVLTDAYNELHGDVVRAAMLEGVAWFMTVHYGELKYRKLVESLQGEGTVGIEDIAKGFKRAMSGADWINTYRAIVQAYNQRTRKAEDKLEMKTSRYTVQVPAGEQRREQHRR